ncbi:hypothetical protein [Paenibacillus thalictri]|uniref:Uncharacterized protein n=1 Tax=Paenibacillus thalictri TaxID=2527873 RepID=A0A4V2J3Z6_9BACL|nr:hypothetical protein [Paenibacillus thalictri]TBL76505.1 hypothetical protein EYB31_18905 [Paenibacillus thalictri]
MDSITAAWVNDYLDLYNYARSIGDSEWEKEIIASLKNKNLLAEYRRNMILRDLWKSYDMINRQLLEVFAELRSSAESNREETLQDRWFQLKLERIHVARKILSYQ